MSPPDTKAANVAARFAWIETVALDPRSSALSIRLAVTLSAMMGTAGYAFPSYEALAAITGASRKAVMETVTKLVANGHLIVDRDPRPGRSRVNHYRRAGALDQQPVWTAWRTWKQSRTGDSLADEEESPFSEKGSPPTDRKSHPQVTRTLEENPGRESGSDPNGSAAPFVAASLSNGWKGKAGDPIPHAFPDDEAMENASRWADLEGVCLDLTSVRRAFLNHHYSVRCLLTDWPRSWEMWIETAIDRAKDAAA